MNFQSFIIQMSDSISTGSFKLDETNIRRGLVAGFTILGTYQLWRIWRLSEQPLQKQLKRYCFSWLRLLPNVRAKIALELNKTRKELEESIHEHDLDREFLEQMAWEAPTDADILARLKRYQQRMGGEGKFDYKQGRVSGTVYTDIDAKHMELLSRIFTQFAYSNPLHPDVFPAVRKMEAEVIRMVADLFNGYEDTCGTMTTGGTESIILACLSARNLALSRYVMNPVILVPATAHAAFDKASHLLGMRIRHVPVDQKTGKVDIDRMRCKIDRNTCLLVGSAPNFPHGAFDDIPAIAKLGLKYNIPVHVDACLGGFLIAFAHHSEAMRHLPFFDFRLQGVTSISCDTHKYGYAPKGTSVILYRNKELLHNQYFAVTEWPGGLYATPTLSGSRAGLNIALTWATLQHFSKQEYARRANLIVRTAAKLAEMVVNIPGIRLVGKPEVSVVAFTSDDLNIHAVGEQLGKRGWNLNFLQLPDALHFCITYNQTKKGVVEAFVADLKWACEIIEALPDKGNSSKMAAIYGMAAKVPDKSIIADVTHLYLDACYSKPPPKTAEENKE